MAKQMKYGRYLHGGDYNPEQWLDRPDILQKDIEYFKKAHINTVSVGIFSWAVLEPEEGKYNFDWLEEIINNLYKEGIYTILATPSGARPKWMADKYEEVLRMDPDRTRRFFGGRHNHCFTSPKPEPSLENKKPNIKVSTPDNYSLSLHDREENLTSGTAIDRCSLLKSLRKLCKKVRQKPDRQGQGKGDVRNDQTCICIEKLQVFQKKIDRA